MGATNERTVIVGFDGSPPSRHAVLWAADAAAARHARLRILTCYDVPIEAPMVPLATITTVDLADGADESVHEAAALAAARHPDLAIDVEVALGRPAGVLVSAAGEAELLVVGSSSHHGAAAFWLGSTARAVARRSPCPVAVVRRAPGDAGVKRVVVGIDGASAGAAALRWAGDSADRAGATLLVVHCWTPMFPPVVSQAGDVDEIEAALVLEQAVDAVRQRCAAPVEQRLVAGDPGRELAAVEGDLLVLGRPRHGALVAGLLGSALNGVLERATVPVVVVPDVPAAPDEVGSAVGRRSRT
jgi:nucleotide-binding universal stress UspA family protein